MPDIDFQKIVLNLIPKKGDEPVIFYASQYESARPFIADLFWGDTEFAPGDDCYAELDIRKNDNNLVVITDDVAIDNNEVSVVLPVQALTCIGKNLGQVKIYGADDQLIAALNFLLEVQPDPLAGGVDSETAIDNLTTQIESIAEEVIGENYYDKTEVDSLLADKADVSDLPDMTQYYTKTQTDTLLNGKADASTTYTKTEVDNALALKANAADLATVATTGDYDDLINKPTIPAAQIQSDYTQADTTAVDYIKNKPDIAGMIAAAIFDILPVGTAIGNPCSFDTEIAAPLQGLTAEIVASGGNGTPSTPIPIVGHSELNLVRCGKNLFNNDVTTYQCSYTSGTMTNTGTDTRTEFYPTVRWYKNGNFINANSGAAISATGRYTLIVNNGLEQCDKIVFGHNGANLDINVSIPINLDSTRAIISFTVDGHNPSTVGGLVVKDIQLELGSTATAYAPYNGQTFTVSFGQTVYGGVYDANAGKVRITWYAVDLGALEWFYNGGLQIFYTYLDLTNNVPIKANGLENVKCSIYQPTTHEYVDMLDGEMRGTDDSAGFNVKDLRFSDTATFKTAMSGIILAYELATPIEIDVSELSVDTIVGVNNITSDCDGDVTVSYKDSIQHYIDNQ